MQSLGISHISGLMITSPIFAEPPCCCLDVPVVRGGQGVPWIRWRAFTPCYATFGGQASRVTIRHAPSAVHTTIQPTTTQMATVVDSVTPGTPGCPL